MSITPQQLKTAIINYTDNEIISHFKDWRKWAVAGFLLLKMEEYNKKIDDALQRPEVQLMGIVDESGMIDDEKILGTLRAVAEQRGDIVQEFPVLGEIRFGKEDISLFEKYVKGVR